MKYHIANIILLLKCKFLLDVSEGFFLHPFGSFVAHHDTTLAEFAVKLGVNRNCGAHSAIWCQKKKKHLQQCLLRPHLSTSAGVSVLFLWLYATKPTSTSSEPNKPLLYVSAVLFD